MNKNAIKSFAIESRCKLMDDVAYRMSLVGITNDGIRNPISSADGFETYDIGGTTHRIFGGDVKRRESLVREVQNKGFDNVVEEVAYTWFNRIIAIRFMEVNDYLPTRTRVLSSETPGKIEPDIITEALDLDLNYTEEDKKEIVKLLDDNKLDELFRFLFIKQCNKLNEILPGLFEKTDDYMELLIGISFTNKEGVIRNLIENIPEEDFTNQVEIIGWLYQFYNTKLKDETFANLKKRIKISKERIPAATQLFTPDWIVKYMVENSLGRFWLENHPNKNLKSKWKYFIEEAVQEPEVEQKLISIRKKSEILKPEDITVIDPCMGSGHILVYVFEVLMDIYISEGFTEKDACKSILKNNIYGLDIDKRAYQLAYFAVLMKARKYNRRILTKNISPLLCSIEETNAIPEEFISELISKDRTIESDLKYIYNSFKDAKEYGSILSIESFNYHKIMELLSNFISDTSLNKFKYQNEIQLFRNILNQSDILTKNYDVVITNPPYMGTNSMNPNLRDYLKINFKNTKNDLSTVFMERSFEFAKEKGFISMINIPVWMFISSYEKLRKLIIEEKTFINMLHLGRGIFGSDFGTTAFILQNNLIKDYKSTFKQLYEDKGAVNSVEKKEQMFFNDNNLFIAKQSNFDKIPNSPIAYWVDNSFIDLFKIGQPLDPTYGDTRSGMSTSDNKRFLRFWYEVDFNKVGLDCKDAENAILSNKKWFSYNKGGKFRKWYGNQDYVINYENDGYELKEYATKLYKSPTRTIKSISEYFKPCLSWSSLSNGKIGFRFYPKGFIFDSKGCVIFFEDLYIQKYIFGFLNSNLCQDILDFTAPTIDYPVGAIASLPILLNENFSKKIANLTDENINLCKSDWDDYEISWNFSSHPLIKFEHDSLKDSYNLWEDYKNLQFNKLKSNETKLNQIFSQIYNLNMTSEIEDKFISIIRADYSNDIKSFISYAVGCMFGRYSLDNEGLQFAGGEFDIFNYHKFIPDDDNIIPVLDTEYFEDDIVGRFVEFVKVCFGEETLEENLNFIANALNKSEKSSREIIRKYFMKDFFKEHVKMYKKCPIYWQFDSGKNNAFKCLIYMHRYDPTIVARVRTDYLHKTQKAIEQNIERYDNIIISESPEKTKAEKLKSKLMKQLDEIKEYDIILAHIANKKIEIDLDDGVKVNYAKFQNIEIQKEGQKTKKVNLLKKI